jgi:hypothetical protein
MSTYIAMSGSCSRADGSKQASENGLSSATASHLTGLFSHRIASWSLQPGELRCSFNRSDAYINRLGNMLVRRQTGGRIQLVVLHSRNDHTLCHTTTLPRADDDDLRTSLQRRFHFAARKRNLYLVLLKQERHCSRRRTVRSGCLRSPSATTTRFLSPLRHRQLP